GLERGAVAGAVPGPIAVVPLHLAAEMSADGRDEVQLARVVAIGGDPLLALAVLEDRRLAISQMLDRALARLGHVLLAQGRLAAVLRFARLARGVEQLGPGIVAPGQRVGQDHAGD